MALSFKLFTLCSSLLLFREYRSDISGITRKSTAKNLIGKADFLTSYSSPVR